MTHDREAMESGPERTQVDAALATPAAMWQRQEAAVVDLEFFIRQRDPVGIRVVLNELKLRHDLLFPNEETK